MSYKILFSHTLPSIILFSVLSLAACAGVDSDTKTTTTTVTTGGGDGGGGSNGATGSNFSSSSIKRKYQFKVNGCDTDEHVIITESEEATQKEYCETLRNKEANHGCAPEFRQALFKAECPGMTWEP